MLTTSCLAADKVRAFLADELPADEELHFERHVAGCDQCQGLIEQLSDDAPTRQLLAEHRRAGAVAATLGATPELDELRERMHVLGWFTNDAAADGGSTFAAQDFAAQDDATHPGESPAAAWSAAGGSAARAAATQAAVTCVGKFQIIQPIGAGGFGVVYLARDRVLHRQVALKLARASVLADPDLKSRFLREAEALARLQHPNIVPVFEAGEHEGTCYLAVAYCDGPTLEQWLRDQQGSIAPRLAARLALTLAEAVEHAHHNGILHRDIKPSNILLDKAPAGAELRFVPKLTDFGLAKIAEQETQTTFSGMLLGTPQYMAPEQAAGMIERICPATDVYALGVVLYEMLTGQLPIRGASPIDTLRRVLIDEPPPPRKLVVAVSDDLEAIVLKCLDKSPTRRYAAAGDLAADLRRFLDGRATLARPLTLGQRAFRLVKRNKAASLVVGLLAAVLLLSGGVVLVNRQLADLRQTVARQQAQADYRDDVYTAGRRYADAEVAQTVELLSRQRPAAGREDLRGFEWHYLWALTTHDTFAVQNHGDDVYQLCLSPQGTQLAAACADGNLYLYDADGLKQQQILKTPHGEINGIAYSPDGRLLATAGDDGMVRIWDARQLQLVHAIAAHQTRAYSAVFYDGGRKLATCGEEPVIRLWDAATGASDGVLEGHTKPVEALALSPVEELLASASEDHEAIVWDLPTRSLRNRLPGHGGKLSCVAFSPDGIWLATGGEDCVVSLWRHAAGRRRAAGFHRDGVQAVAFTRDGHLIAGDRAGTIRTYRLGPQFPVSATEDSLEKYEDQWLAHAGRVWSLAILPGEGGQFVSAGGDGKVRAWHRGQDLIKRWPSGGDPAYAAGYSRDGGKLFVLREKAGIVRLDPATGQAQVPLHEPGLTWDSMAVLPGREQVAAASQSGEIVIWNWRTGNRLLGWQFGDAAFQRLAYCPATQQLAAIAHAREDVLVIDSNTGQVVASLPAPSGTDCAFSPDGRRLAVDTLNQLAIYDLATKRQIALAAGHTLTINAIAYSPDGGMIATASSDRTLRLWTPDGQPLAGPLGHAAEVLSVAFTPDGKSLLSGSRDGRVKVFHVATFRELIDIDAGFKNIRRLVVAPGGRQVAVIGDDWEFALLSVPRRDEEN